MERFAVTPCNDYLKRVGVVLKRTVGFNSTFRFLNVLFPIVFKICFNVVIYYGRTITFSPSHFKDLFAMFYFN